MGATTSKRAAPRTDCIRPWDGRIPQLVFGGLVLIECAVLAMNRGHCPLTGMAGHYTEDRTENFDIHLPLWLARCNKVIFGTLFVLGELFWLWRWGVSVG